MGLRLEDRVRRTPVSQIPVSTLLLGVRWVTFFDVIQQARAAVRPDGQEGRDPSRDRCRAAFLERKVDAWENFVEDDRGWHSGQYGRRVLTFS